KTEVVCCRQQLEWPDDLQSRRDFAPIATTESTVEVVVDRVGHETHASVAQTEECAPCVVTPERRLYLASGIFGFSAARIERHRRRTDELGELLARTAGRERVYVAVDVGRADRPEIGVLAGGGI